MPSSVESAALIALRCLPYFGPSVFNCGLNEYEVNALTSGNIDEFLRLVSKSGDSSYKYLQNIYSTKDTANQGVSLGLMMSEIFLGDNSVYSNGVR